LMFGAVLAAVASSPALAEPVFNRIASFPIVLNLPADRDAKTKTVAEIIAAVDETIDSTRCGGKANCQREQPCLTHDLWMGLSDQIRQYLDSISLQDVLTRKNVRRVAERQDRDVKAAMIAIQLEQERQD